MMDGRKDRCSATRWCSCQTCTHSRTAWHHCKLAWQELPLLLLAARSACFEYDFHCMAVCLAAQSANMLLTRLGSQAALKP